MTVRLRQNRTDSRNSEGFSPPAFDVDGMLGALAKWLRILGFDAAFPCKAPSRGRLYVTVRRIAGRSDTIIVEDRDPLEQLKQVLQTTGISPDPELFLTRCLICNVPVHDISREKAEGRVPEEVLQIATIFNECPKCGRVYWEGSHNERIRRRLQESGLR